LKANKENVEERVKHTSSSFSAGEYADLQK